MKRPRTKTCFVLLVVLLTHGCVIPPSETEEYVPPANAESGEPAVVHVYRVKAFLGSGNDIDIFVDGKKAGEIGNGGSISFRVTPGVHTITPHGWKGGSYLPAFRYSQIGNSIERDFQSGEKYYLRWKYLSLKDALDTDLFQITNEEMYREGR